MSYFLIFEIEVTDKTSNIWGGEIFFVKERRDA
jgi:hypothetical protein